MSYGILENDVIVNVVEASAEFAEEQGWIELPQNATIGWTYSAGTFEPPATQPQEPFFPTLTRKQLRNGLLSIGVTSAEVEAQIAAIPDPLEREAAMIDWQDTQSYQRDYPMITQIGAALGLPEDQIDALWLWSAGQ